MLYIHCLGLIYLAFINISEYIYTYIYVYFFNICNIYVIYTLSRIDIYLASAAVVMCRCMPGVYTCML